MNDIDRLVTDGYERYKGEVLRTVSSKLSAAGVKTSLGELEGPYNEAWHALYMKLAEGEEIVNRVAFLVTVTHRRALSEYRASRAGLRAAEGELDEVGMEFDLDAQLDAEIKVRHFVEGLRASLSEREFEAATLCHLHGYSRPEAARAIGVKPKRMEKIMDGASNRIAEIIERVQAGEHCEGMSSQIRAYAVGMLDPEGERYRQAVDHIAHCPACRRQVWVLRGLAAAVPPFPGLLALTAGSATTAGIGAKGVAATAARPEGAAAGASGGSGASGSSAGAAAGAATDTGGKAGLIAAGAATLAVAAAAAVGVATGAIGGGDGSDDPAPLAVTSTAAGTGSDSAQAAAKQAKAKAKAKAKARAKARAEARAERRRRQKAATETAPVVVEAPPPEPVYVPPEPAYVPPPPPPPEPEPEPEPDPEPPAKPDRPEKPTTDASDEFGLR